jgi:F-type H+-transporting ATPase subunit c
LFVSSDSDIVIDAPEDPCSGKREGGSPQVESDILLFVATLTTLGKSVGFGLAVGLAAFGTAIGLGHIFSSMIQSSARQPEVKAELQPLMWLGFALTEAVVFYGLVGGVLLVVLV